jgi:hypothetical protein
MKALILIMILWAGAANAASTTGTATATVVDLSNCVIDVKTKVMTCL